MAADDTVDQPRDLGRERESGVPWLPLLDNLATRQAEAPDNPCFEREPGDRHPELLEIAIDRVVVMRDTELRLGAQPVLDSRPRVTSLRELECAKADRVVVRWESPAIAHPDDSAVDERLPASGQPRTSVGRPVSAQQIAHQAFTEPLLHRTRLRT